MGKVKVNPNAVGVKLSTAMPKGEQAYGLDALAEVMRRGTDTQYVLLAVQPVEDVASRTGEGRSIKTVIVALEGLADPDHRRAAERMLDEARAARLGYREDQLPEPPA